MNANNYIEISSDTHHKLECLKCVVEAAIGEQVSFEACIELVLSRGITSMIRDVLPPDVEILLKSMEQLFDEYPDSTSKFIAETLKFGEEIQLKKRWFGEQSESTK